MTSRDWFIAAGAALQRQRAALVAGDAAALAEANDALIRLLEDGCQFSVLGSQFSQSSALTENREPTTESRLQEQIRVQASLAENGLAATTRFLQAVAGTAPGALLSGVA